MEISTPCLICAEDLAENGGILDGEDGSCCVTVKTEVASDCEEDNGYSKNVEQVHVVPADMNDKGVDQTNASSSTTNGWSEDEKRIFQLFLKWFGVPIKVKGKCVRNSVNLEGWDGSSADGDKFPFCTSCKSLLMKVLEMTRIVEELQQKIKKSVESVSKKANSCEDVFENKKIYVKDARYLGVRQRIVTDFKTRYGGQSFEPKQEKNLEKNGTSLETGTIYSNDGTTRSGCPVISNTCPVVLVSRSDKLTADKYLLGKANPKSDEAEELGFFDANFYNERDGENIDGGPCITIGTGKKEFNQLNVQTSHLSRRRSMRKRKAINFSENLPSDLSDSEEPDSSFHPDNDNEFVPQSSISPSCSKTSKSKRKRNVQILVTTGEEDTKIPTKSCITSKPKRRYRKRNQNPDKSPSPTSQQKHLNSLRSPIIRRSRPVCQRQISTGYVVYMLEKNILLYHYTTFKYCPESRTFTCQEPNCSVIIPEWENSPILELKTHVEKEHNPDWKPELVFKGDQRSCPLCPVSLDNPVQFRNHLTTVHREYPSGPLNRRKKPAICEICLKHLSSNYYLTHIWTHKSDEDAVADITAGEPVASWWIRGLEERKTEPIYSRVMSLLSTESTSNQNDDKEDSAAMRTTIEKPQQEQTSYIYLIDDATIAYKFTLLKIENNGSKLVCTESGCDATFQACPLQYYEQFNEMIMHVNKCHSNKTENQKINYKNSANKKVVCQSCLMPLSNHSNYRYHTWTHLNVQEKSEFCSKKLRNPNICRATRLEYQEKANKLAAGLEPKLELSCETCGKKLTSMQSLKAHHLVHLPVQVRRKWSCERCKKEFLSAVAVRNHIERIHQPELKKIRECPVVGCSKKFNKRDGTKFNCHMRKHKGETPWICDFCGRGFIANYQLKRHREDMHTDRKRHQCEKCGKDFGSRKYLSVHKKKEHR